MPTTGGREPRLAVIGLGKLGAPMAAVFAAKGYDVIGVDLNPANVEAINNGRAPVEEPQLHLHRRLPGRHAASDGQRRGGAAQHRQR